MRRTKMTSDGIMSYWPPNLVNTSCCLHYPTLSGGDCFDKGYKHYTLWTESQPNCRSVSGAITIIVQEVGITNSLAGRVSADQWSPQLTGYKLPPMADNHLKGFDPIPVLHSRIFGKGKPHRVSSNEADNLMSVNKRWGISNCAVIIPQY